MKHIHKRFTATQVILLLTTYLKRRMTREEVQEELGIGKTRFFFLLKKYQKDTDSFDLTYKRYTRSKLSGKEEEAIHHGLQEEKRLIDNPQLPIYGYNYSALRDRLREQQEVVVSVPTIIKRAKSLGWYQPKRKKTLHDREVITSSIGALIQHDASLHLWSPYAREKWTLITSLDDFSRRLLYAEFVPHETTWTHIQAASEVVTQYGFPLRYYVDNLRIFRFVQGRDSMWRNHILHTDDVDPQWRQVMRTAGVDVIHALSPQAKGKIERPYRWLQDRIVRTCALEHITTLTEAQSVLQLEVKRYNSYQVHSTTKEIPDVRFSHANQTGNSLFRPFTVPTPFLDSRDLFCLREKRIVNSYHRITLGSREITIPKVPIRESVTIHMIPNKTSQIIDLRFWWENKLVHTLTYPIADLPSVHF